MVNNQIKSQSSPAQGEKMTTTQKIFKYVNIILLSILIYCIPGFLAFRNHNLSQGYHVFKLESLIWAVLGFFGIYILKYTYYYLIKDTLASILHPKYTGDEREYKLKALLKFTLDVVFYSSTTIMAYSLFRNQYWFPSAVGGVGSCDAIYKQYPNWPTNSQTNLQIYYMIQLGVHAFSVFEMVVIKRGTERKYYQYLLHHCLAMSLILFSMMCNQTAAGAMILIVHDFSDIFAAFGRGFVETKFQIKKLNIFLYILMTFVWIYMRHVVYPGCLLYQVYASAPNPSNEWYMIRFEYSYLLGMACVLECMHIFWTYFLLKLGFKQVKWQSLTNIHQNEQKKS